jgi:cell division protein FtsW (lipid II flippase)
MILTREELAQRALDRQRQQQLARTMSRNRELLCLLAGSAVIAIGLWLVVGAKTRNLAEEHLVNINQLAGPQELVPLLKMIPNAADQDRIANEIYDAKRRGMRFENDGAIARMRSTRPPERLLTAQQFSALKPSIIVRRPDQFRRSFWISIAIFFVPFYLLHLAWRTRRFAGDNLLLPVVHVLCGIGLILMISLRDPLRDTLMFGDFAQGVMAGCIALGVFSFLDYERHFSRLSYIPLLASFLLAIALGLFGSGPGTSDAKVNLFFFQPVEVIRILIVLFLAGYFAQNWDALRQLRDRRSRFNMPRLDYALPVVFGVAGSLLLFFWLSDLGPALVIGCLFLTMYSIARKKVGLAAAGLATIMAGFVIGYALGYPHTVSERVNMWRSPWDNHVHGGDQLADSLWSLATGGATGTGLGLGNPEIVPAAHTDLILSALGEQLGFLGIVAVFSLYGFLIYRSLRIAIRAPASYSFFLTVGLALIFGYQILLIASGLLGLIPLSGVVSPFLSYGRTSMVANFAAIGAVLAISSRMTARTQEENFGAPARTLVALLAGLVLVVIGRAAYIQTVKANDLVVRGALVLQADGVRRYQYNPRLLEIARQIPKGTIFDRNGLPLATSDWKLLGQHRPDFERMGIHLEQTTSQAERRQYPLGAPLFYLLGDTRNRLKQGATNTAFQENTSRVRLQGYDDVAEVEEARDPQTGQITSRVKRDYRALVPLLRHRYEPDNPQVKEILSRPRDVRMSIDAPFELRVTEILKQHLAKLGKQKGAVVVLDPATGDLLAAASLPLPSADEFASLSANPEAPIPDQDLLDRARFGLYPPGSSFKIVTAIAALRKDPALAQQKFECIRLPDGRVGNIVGKRIIRDDIKDTAPHGTLDIGKGIAVSCNAYFAQLGAERVGAQALYDTAALLGISVARPNTPEQLKQFLAQASYGQGQVVASPFQMARVAATIANGGNAPQGRWIVDETNPRVRAPEPVLSRELAAEVAGFMRSVVTSGTARVLNNSRISIAGKTGTAELAKDASHAWFIGFAPYGASSGKQIAFAVLVENGQYGGTSAAPIAGDIVAAARELGIL